MLRVACALVCASTCVVHRYAEFTNWCNNALFRSVTRHKEEEILVLRKPQVFVRDSVCTGIRQTSGAGPVLVL